MVKALLGKIENVFKPDFLFASFLPTLLFVVSLAVLIGEVIGYESIVAYAEGWSSNAFGLSLAASLAVGVVILAYVFYGLRSWFLKLWAGQIEGALAWFCYPGQYFFKHRFHAQRANCNRQPQWDSIWRGYQQRAYVECERYDPSKSEDFPWKERDYLLQLVGDIDDTTSKPELDKIFMKILEANRKYKEGENHGMVWSKFKLKLKDLIEQEKSDQTRRLAELDRQFGKSSFIRPTALGNIIEAYNSYPYKRYGIEGEVFWPHIESRLPEAFQAKIDDLKVLLDFFLTMATLGVLVGCFALLVGPWLRFTPFYWAAIGATAILVSYNIYYKMAVILAMQYGDLIRASFDMYRLDLLDQLSIPRPTDSAEERSRWQKLSELVVFGVQEAKILYEKTPPKRDK